MDDGSMVFPKKENMVPVHPPIIAPGAMIGLLGGGQLGRMLALAGRAMGYRFAVLDPAVDAPAVAVCDVHIAAPFADTQGARQLARTVDVVTYEFENVDAHVTEALAQAVYVPQGAQLLYTTQHRLREKRAIVAAGVAVVPYDEVHGFDDIIVAMHRYGRIIVKTTTGGYDGLGQWRIASLEEAERAWGQMRQQQTSWIAESWISFACELSVVVARRFDGTMVAFPPARNVHRSGILHTSTVDAQCIPTAWRERAQTVAKTVAEALGVVGLLAVELFVTSDGTMYVNELAPRPHNSAHYTMDACTVSQFEQHIRAICGLPLVVPRMHASIVMVNVLGQHVARIRDGFVAGTLERTLEAEQVQYHEYGKTVARHGRKMGHLNVLTNDVSATLQAIERSTLWE